MEHPNNSYAESEDFGKFLGILVLILRQARGKIGLSFHEFLELSEDTVTYE